LAQGALAQLIVFVVRQAERECDFFDRYFAPQHLVPGEPDPPHAANPQRVLESISSSDPKISVHRHHHLLGTVRRSALYVGANDCGVNTRTRERAFRWVYCPLPFLTMVDIRERREPSSFSGDMATPGHL